MANGRLTQNAYPAKRTMTLKKLKRPRRPHQEDQAASPGSSDDDGGIKSNKALHKKG